MEKLVPEVVDRLSLAFRLNSNLFLMIYYQRQSLQKKFLEKLYQQMKGAGLAYHIFDPVNNPRHRVPEIHPNIIAAASKGEVCLIPQLPRSKTSPEVDRDFLAYMNLHRDALFAQPLRLLLFLELSDGELFIDTAGDLWDFRHHTYWLEPDYGTGVINGSPQWKKLQDITGPVHRVTVESPEEIHRHVKNVESQVLQTRDADGKARLLLDLTGWLLRRRQVATAGEIASKGLQYTSGKPSISTAKLESLLGYIRQLTSEHQ